MRYFFIKVGDDVTREKPWFYNLLNDQFNSDNCRNNNSAKSYGP